jgi:hypothetical protein
MPSAVVIPSLSPASDFATMFGPLAALAVAAVLIALIVLVAGLVVEALDARAQARMRIRARAGRGAAPVPRAARRPRAA